MNLFQSKINLSDVFLKLYSIEKQLKQKQKYFTLGFILVVFQETLSYKYYN